MYRIGNGYDVHRLVPGCKLILGGVEIPHALGLEGHSDADALLHALGDAILGACGAGDIGSHFPDTDAKWKGADSLVLLEKISGIAMERGWEVSNADATIVAQKPRLASYLGEMKKNIAATLNIRLDQINIKATTTEKLGFTGREEGMAAFAVVLLQEINPF
jgi:2-C-methyl-D-erythritol 2,4-cyclodiphosphate synthase